MKYDDCPRYGIFMLLLHVLQSKKFENLIFVMLKETNAWSLGFAG